jgi:hypothetical protein
MIYIMVSIFIWMIFLVFAQPPSDGEEEDADLCTNPNHLLRKKYLSEEEEIDDTSIDSETSN